jgi:cell division protein FtsB
MRIQRFFQHPGQVFFLCLIFLLMTLIVKGTLLRLWNLHQEVVRIQADVLTAQEKIQKLDLAIARVKDPSYLERQARERLDLVSENDLVFLFPSE